MTSDPARELGATSHGTGASFALWAPGAERVELCLFDELGREERIELAEEPNQVWAATAPVGPGQPYGYRVHGTWAPERGARWNPAKLLLDPYARAISGDFVLDDAVFGHQLGSASKDDRDSAPFVPKSIVVDGRFDWGADRSPKVAWPDTIIYEMHVRGFTKLHPDVPASLRGTYAGLAHPAAVEHLVSLGVTSVELLPVHHFVSEPRLLRMGLSNYWGYNSIGFFAPHAGYSASGTRGQQVTEFREMVRALHAAGVEVILDVVYNHTAETDEAGPTLSFRGIGNAAYYRLRDGSAYENFTGCGNTVDCRLPRVVQLVMDSLRYWATEMHVDGFRFDLATALARWRPDYDPYCALLTAIAQDPVLNRLKLIAEPWDVGAGGYQLGRFPPIWSEWNDKYRDTIRDFWRGAAGRRDLGSRLAGSSDIFQRDGRRPHASINFVTAHDGFTLRDLVSYNHKHNDANGEDNRDGSDDNRSSNWGAEGETDDPDILAVRRRQLRNMLMTLLLSAGVPMLSSGDEIGRTQRGNNNVYCQDNELAWLDWDLAPWQQDLLATARRLVEIRRTHQVFRRRHFFTGAASVADGRKDIAWFGPDGQEIAEAGWFGSDTPILGTYLAGAREAGPGRSTSFLLLYNNGAQTDVVLPGLPYASSYSLVLDTAEASGDSSFAAGARLSLAAQSAVLLEAHPDTIGADVPDEAN